MIGELLRFAVFIQLSLSCVLQPQTIFTDAFAQNISLLTPSKGVSFRSFRRSLAVFELYSIFTQVVTLIF